ncbi:hypothetical protein QQY79_17800 [Flavobacterium tructae]|uniref:hypothetical protein n=1 Tax=Flavobacterium tructae TaxID=1114873 RepID=UPI002551DFB2|nr:hypothetical protein [Flavobacterium tructae]MDL2144386.1 hypothetical protein [Flavobacterium tructae]
MNGLESMTNKALPNETTASSFDVTVYNNYYEKRERGASHIENIIRGELISNGVKNMSIRSTYSANLLNYTGGSLYKYNLQTSAIKILNYQPQNYNAQGYLNKMYNLPTPKK